MRLITAYILAVTRTGREYDVAEKISRLENVREVTITYGTWDLVIKIEVDSMAQLDNLVTTIRQIDDIVRTETLIGI
ncbi:MAG: Lrp/AsnC ligand binding domain-containing protein [Thermoproteales archaeon]|nr:Lrp/AsnC ligand binding domain-containing protein [Thermoproteales archaeon]